MPRIARFDQRTRALAKDRQCGMMKVSYSGEFFPDDADKSAVTYEGPMAKVDFDKMRDFMIQLLSTRTSTLIPSHIPAVPIEQTLTDEDFPKPE